jgi:putative CocE/NonD family hydrolase
MRNLKVLIVIFTLFTLVPYLCLTQEISQPTYKVIEELDVKVTMRDGIRLSTNIYRPDASGRFPVLLMRTPYDNGGIKNTGAHFYAQRGYVVVVQDTRGRFESEGIFDAFQSEALDGYDTQQWIGDQFWSNRKIGTFGSSYVGFTQWITAPLQCPYLITMVTSKTFTDLHDVIYLNGCFLSDVFTPWSINMTKPYNLDIESITRLTDSALRSLPLISQDSSVGWRIPFLKDWLLHPGHDKYWDRTFVGNNFSKIKTSVYNIGGWYDIFLNATLNNYTSMTTSSIDPKIRKKQKLIIGPWVHKTSGRKVGVLDFGEDASESNIVTELQLRWFDNQLKGINNGIMEEPPVRIFVMGENKWRFENEWPLARTKYQNYYFHSKGNANTLSGDGLLSTELPKFEKSDRFIYDPDNPLPTVASVDSYNQLSIETRESMGPYDQTSTETREDVLEYTTPPLKNSVEVTGNVQVILFASSSAVNTDFTAKLVDVYPDGSAIRLCEGIIRASHRDLNNTPSNIEPGKVYKFTIDLWATSNLFKEGHKIRVEVSSSNFPRFDRNLNTGNSYATNINSIKAEQTIYHSKDFPSCIVLPVIEN